MTHESYTKKGLMKKLQQKWWNYKVLFLVLGFILLVNFVWAAAQNFQKIAKEFQESAISDFIGFSIKGERYPLMHTISELRYRVFAEKLGIKNCYESIDGLEHIFDLSEGQGARAVVDFVGETETASAAITYLGNQGKYVAVGTGGEVRISTAELVAREISIMGSFVGTYTDLVEITELAIRGDIVSQVTAYPMSEVNRALHDLAQGHVIGRAVLVPD